jgi:cell division protein FtsL
MENERKMTLGCGTLILIALIVLIFGNISLDRSTKPLIQLQRDVRTLQGMVSSQGDEIKGMRRDIQRLLDQNK